MGYFVASAKLIQPNMNFLDWSSPSKENLICLDLSDLLIAQLEAYGPDKKSLLVLRNYLGFCRKRKKLTHFLVIGSK